MVIKASSSAEIRTLIESLSGPDRVRREAAIARLSVIGARATDRLIAAYGTSGEPAVRVGILRALEATGDPRAMPLACEALHRGDDPAVAAAAVLRPLLNAGDPAIAAGALDALVEVALDPSKERRVRLAAYDALQDMPAALLAPLKDLMKADQDKNRKAGTARDTRDTVVDALWSDALDGRLPDDPAELRHALAEKAQVAALGSLRKLIDGVRAREDQTDLQSLCAAWRAVRGEAHQALALRGSRIAMYDLRETVEASTSALPPTYLAAMRLVGDRTCVEALAAALARAPEGDLWWRHQLASTLRAIARREGMTKRHASMKRVIARWPQAADILR